VSKDRDPEGMSPRERLDAVAEILAHALFRRCSPAVPGNPLGSSVQTSPDRGRPVGAQRSGPEPVGKERA
jgi:hypothetical protein